MCIILFVRDYALCVFFLNICIHWFGICNNFNFCSLDIEQIVCFGLLPDRIMWAVWSSITPKCIFF